MTLFFDIHKLEAQAQGSDLKFINIFKDYYDRKTFSKLQVLKYSPIEGNSWILNPAPLIGNISDLAYVVQYIKLAGRRDYSLYKLYNQISLDCSFYTDLNFNTIKRNPLLQLINNHIHFKFEKIYLDAKLNKLK